MVANGRCTRRAQLTAAARLRSQFGSRPAYLNDRQFLRAARGAVHEALVDAARDAISAINRESRHARNILSGV